MRMVAAACTWLLMTVVVAPSSLAAADKPAAARRFSPGDVFKLKSVGDVRISPDGRTVAYEALDTDIMIDGRRRSIRLIDIASGGDRLLAEDARSPRWSPDGRSLVYADRKDGAERLVLSRLDNGPSRVVMDVPGGASAVTWSRDGRMLAFTRFVPADVKARDFAPARPEGARWAPSLRIVTTLRHDEDGQGAVTPGHTQLFVMPATGGTPRQITSGPLDVSGDSSWAPDGRSLIYSAVNLDAFGDGFRAGRLYRVPVTGGEPVQLTGKDLAAQSPSVSPDGRSVAFIAWAVDGRDYSPIRLRLLDLRTGRSRVLEERLDRDFFGAAWSADGKSVYATYADRSIDKVRRIDVSGGASTDVATDVGGDFTVSDRGLLAYAMSRSQRPADVALVGAGRETPRLLTRRNDDLLGDKSLGEVMPLAVTSTLDGAQVGAWLTRPAGYVDGTRYPLILDIHGGPYGYDGPEWRTRDQLYAAAGYAVLHVNYRGSTSYGFAFADRIAADPLAPSYTDLMSAVDAAVRAGVADPKQLFVTGGSAGGELTAWIVGRTDRFRAAMAEKPIINQTARILTSDQYYAIKLVDGPEPWNDAARRWSLSPLSAVQKVSTPTMLIVGEEDRRTPPAEALQFYHALKLRGVPTALILVPKASHASLGAKPSQLIAMVGATLDWFDQSSKLR